jgi:hypothetical protein
MRHLPALRATWGIALALGLGCSKEASRDESLLSEPEVPTASRGGLPHRDAAAVLDAVLAGNAQSLVAAPTLVPPGVPLTPFIEARLYAIANVAMHDALNAIRRRFERYADAGDMDSDANPSAAVLTAAHDAIVGAAPGAAGVTDAWYGTEMDQLSGAEGLEAGVEFGRRAAAAILARRQNDGVAAGGVAPYTPGTSPGDYQFTPPFDGPPFDIFGTGGFADASVWAQTVTPFVVSTSAQFRAPPPYGAGSNAAAVLTPAYTADYQEVAALGCSGCSARSAEQTEIALFWMESSPVGWNRIARVIANQRQLDAWDTARLFALLQMGEFDAYTTSADSKYHYAFWRPVSAIALALNDGNAATAPVSGWEALAPPTPPVPDYPSAHATAGGAAAAIIEALVPGRGPAFSTTSGSLPGASRRFASVADAARENALSRIYIGYHFRHATAIGLTQGRAVGDYVASSALPALHHSR